MRNNYLITVPVIIVVLLVMVGCGNDVARPVSVDMPQLASALRFMGKCAVACTIVGGLSLIGSSLLKGDRSWW